MKQGFERDFIKIMGAPTPQPQQKKKNFWLDQISTAGGILGGIGGSFVAPIAGTAAGAGAGSALGEALENLITGDSLGKNVAKEGALGAVFGAGPIKLAKGAGAGIKALATGSDDVIGAASRAALTPLRRNAGKAITGAADNLAIKQFRLTPTQLTNFQKKFGEDAGQVIRKYGFQSVDDIASKGIEPIQQQFDEAITGIAGVTKDSLKKNLTKRISTLSKAGPSDTKAIGAQLKKEANDLLKPFGDVIDAKELNVIRRQFDDLVNYTERASNPARYGVNKRMADAIRETLQQADQSGSLKGLGRELNKLRQLADVASRQGNLGRGSLPLGLGMMPGAVFGASGGPAGAAAGMAAQAVANSGAGRRAMMRGAEKLGGGLARSGSTGQSPLGIAGRVGAGGMLGGLGQSLENNEMSPNTMSPSMNMPMASNMMGESYNEIPSQASTSPFAPENIESNIQAIVASGGSMSDVMEFIKVAEAINKLTTGGGSKPLTGEARNRALKAQSGLRSLDTLESTLSSDPGAFQRQALPNPFGITARLTGTTDVRAATDNIVDVIARMRSGAAITDSEAARFARLLPQPGDSEESALRKLQNVRAELESYMQPDTGMGSLEDALMQYAQ